MLANVARALGQIKEFRILYISMHSCYMTSENFLFSGIMDSLTSGVLVCSCIPSIKDLHHARIFEEAISKQVHASVYDSGFPIELHNNKDFCEFL